MDELADTQLEIKVRAYREDEFLCFEISDDGIGIPHDKRRTLLTQDVGASGIGLKNVHERILLIYGKPYGLSILSEEDEGTTVIIRLPLNTGGEGP